MRRQAAAVVPFKAVLTGALSGYRDSCSYCRCGMQKLSRNDATRTRLGAAHRPARVRCGSHQRADPASSRLDPGESPRPIIPSPGTPDGYRNRDPRRDHDEDMHKKALCAPGKESRANGNKSPNTGSRKHAVATAHSSSAFRLQQRAGLKGYFANSTRSLATRRPRGDADRLYGRSPSARAGNHRQNKAQQHKDGQGRCYEHWILDSVAVTKALWACVSCGDTISWRHCSRRIVPSTPDAAARTSGTRTGRAKATSALCASICTRDPRIAIGSVSLI